MMGNATEADLAAARAALERLWDEVKNDYVDEVWGRDDQKAWVEATLARLGTGEALAAVREAQQVIANFTDTHVGKVFYTRDAENARARLKAVFGE